MASDCALSAVDFVYRGSKESTILKAGCSHWSQKATNRPTWASTRLYPTPADPARPTPPLDQVAPPNTKRPQRTPPHSPAQRAPRGPDQTHACTGTSHHLEPSPYFMRSRPSPHTWPHTPGGPGPPPPIVPVALPDTKRRPHHVADPTSRGLPDSWKPQPSPPPHT